MKIYTKFGDKGFTSLLFGKKVRKHNIAIDACGNIDELNSYLGLIRDIYNNPNIIDDLIEIQKKIFIIGSELVTPKSESKKTKLKIQDDDISFLEKRIDEMSNDLSPMTHFILPGGNPVISHCHIARSICRRAERKISLLNKKNAISNLLILKFINRLSDYIFTISRKYASDNGINEIKWIP